VHDIVLVSSFCIGSKPNDSELFHRLEADSGDSNLIGVLGSDADRVDYVIA